MEKAGEGWRKLVIVHLKEDRQKNGKNVGQRYKAEAIKKEGSSKFKRNRSWMWCVPATAQRIHYACGTSSLRTLTHPKGEVVAIS